MSLLQISSSYMKVSSRATGGFKLRYSRRFSIHAFRTRFMFLFKVVTKWKYTYSRAMKFLKRGVHGHGNGGDRRIGKVSGMGTSRSMNGLLVSDMNMARSHECRMRSFARSNSFYSEAIADCLEFIKRTSVSDKDEEDKPVDKNSTDDKFQISPSNRSVVS